MACPSCNLDPNRMIEIILERFLENGFSIKLDALLAFVKKCVEEFGEINLDDVDSLCNFVDKRFGARKIEIEHVESYFNS